MEKYYLLRAKYISRSNNQNIVKEAAYISRSKLTDLNTGKTYNSKSRGECPHEEIRLQPQSAVPRDREALWSLVERIEKRKDAVLAYLLILGLPDELTVEQQIELVQSFIDKYFVSKGRVADIAIHPPPPDGDIRHWHCHCLISLRVTTPDGFGNKNREWTPYRDPSLLLELREAWADTINITLERYGHEGRVDHRSFRKQGLEQEPKKFKHNARFYMERAQKKQREKEQQQEIEKSREIDKSDISCEIDQSLEIDIER